MNQVPGIQFVERPLWQRILIAVWPPYARAKAEENRRTFEAIMREWREAGL